MAFDLYTFVVAAYAGTILCALFAEFAPWPRFGRAAARTAIVLALAGGTSWSVVVYQRGYIFSPAEKAIFAKRSGEGGTVTLFGGRGAGGAKNVTLLSRSGGRDPDLEGDGASTEGEPGGGSTIEILFSKGGGSGPESIVEKVLPGRTWQPPGKPREDREGDVKRDCPGCPEMVIVASGTALLGAPDSDLRAMMSERPQRPVRLWPGFAISRFPISAQEFDEFRAEAALPVRTCPGASPEPRLNAVCLTAADAEGYAGWLSTRTGKRFRLPTAIEWEFAARTRGSVVVAIAPARGALAADAPAAFAPLAGIGRGVAEMTADCYDPYFPSAGRERRSWETNPLLCAERVLKGAGAGESEQHTRFSARRPWRADEPAWTVGFRVVRDLS